MEALCFGTVAASQWGALLEWTTSLHKAASSLIVLGVLNASEGATLAWQMRCKILVGLCRSDWSPHSPLHIMVSVFLVFGVDCDSAEISTIRPILCSENALTNK